MEGEVAPGLHQDAALAVLFLAENDFAACGPISLSGLPVFLLLQAIPALGWVLGAEQFRSSAP